MYKRQLEDGRAVGRVDGFQAARQYPRVVTAELQQFDAVALSLIHISEPTRPY